MISNPTGLSTSPINLPHRSEGTKPNDRINTSPDSASSSHSLPLMNNRGLATNSSTSLSLNTYRDIGTQRKPVQKKMIIKVKYSSISGAKCILHQWVNFSSDAQIHSGAAARHCGRCWTWPTHTVLKMKKIQSSDRCPSLRTTSKFPQPKVTSHFLLCIFSRVWGIKAGPSAFSEKKKKSSTCLKLHLINYRVATCPKCDFHTVSCIFHTIIDCLRL